MEMGVARDARLELDVPSMRSVLQGDVAGKDALCATRQRLNYYTPIPAGNHTPTRRATNRIRT